MRGRWSSPRGSSEGLEGSRRKIDEDMLNADESILHRDEEESGHSGKIIESAVEKGAGQELRSHEPRDSPVHVCGIGSRRAWAQLGEED